MNDLIEIFIIDDHPIYIDGIIEAFNKSQINKKYYVSGSAYSIKDARKNIENSNAEVILLDLKLPGENGVDYCAELKNKYPDKKIIALTGETDNTTLYGAWMNNADAIVMKYTGVRELLSVINTVRRGDRVIGKDVPIVFGSINPDSDRDKPFLTHREQQVLTLLIAGHTRREVAEKIFISNETVNTHCKKMFAKFKVNNLQSLIKKVNQK